MQPWEFGSLPRSWIGPMSDEVDEVWAYSRFVRDCYIASGVPADRVHVVPLGVDPRRFHPGAKPFPLKTTKPFKFLFVGGTIHRKGIDVLLKAYAETFTAADPVCLVIKDMGGDSFYRGQTAAERIGQIQSAAGAPEIEYLDRELGARRAGRSLYGLRLPGAPVSRRGLRPADRRGDGVRLARHRHRATAPPWIIAARRTHF